MIHSSMLVIATDRECLTCIGFSLSETVHFGSLEFIIDCFGCLSLSPKGGGGGESGAIFMGTTRSGSSSLWDMIKNSLDGFYMASSGEGSFGLPVF
jgi:hypothetical protein